MSQRIGRRIVQVPDKAVKASFGRKNLLWPNPIHGDGIFRGDFVHRFGLVSAGVATDQMILGIENFQLHLAVGTVGQQIIKDRAIGGILSGRNFRRKRRIGIAIPAEAHSGLRSE